MSPSVISSAQLEIVEWVARVGAVSAEALAVREGCSVSSARARLQHAKRSCLLSRERPLTDLPALFSPTYSGLRAVGLDGVRPGRVRPANAGHLYACAHVAATLERSYPDYRISGERDLRVRERSSGRRLASTRLSGSGGAPLHRPDLVLWPVARDGQLPVAVEVELTVKAPRRLAAICRAWARCRGVAGVLYLVTPKSHRPVRRAVAAAQAGQAIVVLELEGLESVLPAGSEGERENHPRP